MSRAAGGANILDCIDRLHSLYGTMVARITSIYSLTAM